MSAALTIATGDLAERIQAAHDAFLASARTAVENACRCGELLLQAKGRVPHGEWERWVAEHCTFAERTARAYMQVAHRLLNHNGEERQRVADLSLRETLTLLAEPRDTPAPLPWSGAVEWYTPPEFIEAARQVMGGIDLDPASNDTAQKVVRADTYYTKEHDGLVQEWAGRVWLNPPYAAGKIDEFVGKLIAEHTAGNVTEAVLLVHSRTDTTWFHEAAAKAAAVCFTRGRVSFQRPDGTGDAPPIDSAFLYYGDSPDRFAATFGSIGLVYGRVVQVPWRAMLESVAA